MDYSLYEFFHDLGQATASFGLLIGLFYLVKWLGEWHERIFHRERWERRLEAEMDEIDRKCRAKRA